MGTSNRAWVCVHELTIAGASVGVYPHERTSLRTVVLDLELATDIARATRSAALTDTIDYDEVARLAQTVVLEKHWPLLEGLADSVARALLEAFPAKHVVVTVSKPGALASGHARVRVERRRRKR